MPWLLILQIALLIGWYTVPALAVLSAWIIFIPLMLAALRLLFVVGVLGLAVWASI